MTPRCDACGQPTIGTAFCTLCANDREARRAEMDTDYWTGAPQ